MRIRSLDSVRGLAATVVVAHHASLIFVPVASHVGDASFWLFDTPLRLLVAGPAAVYVFFVLSGMVLTLPFAQGQGDLWPHFIAKRILRVWLPFAVAIIGSAALKILVGAAPLAGASWWLAETWKTHLSAESVLATLAMTGSNIDLDNPMWSLVHEMRISLVFPLLVVLVRNRPFLLLLSASIMAVAATTMIAASSVVGIGLFETLPYGAAFVAGIVMALRLQAIRGWLAARRPAVMAALWLAAVIGLAASPTETCKLVSLSQGFRLLVNMGGAALLVALCAGEGRHVRLLCAKLPMFLGRISYSLYLVHVPVLVATVRFASPSIGLPASLAAGVAFSFAAATMFCHYVEVPAARLSKKVGSLLAPKPIWIAASV